MNVAEDVGIVGSTTNFALQKGRREANDKKCIRELRGALPPIVYNYVRSCKTTKEIWDTLKENYQGNEKTKKRYVK